MKFKKTLIVVSAVLLLIVGYKVTTNVNLNPEKNIGDILDSFNGVNVYYNGGVNHVLERNTTADGYNIGLKYQCVEFVKRYYLEYYNHKMPDSYGHAKDFFDHTIAHGELNPRRNLRQYQNHHDEQPAVGDLLVYKPTINNPYGHVAIVSKVDIETMNIEIIQQNPGPFSQSRAEYPLSYSGKQWSIDKSTVVGWLRM